MKLPWPAGESFSLRRRLLVWLLVATAVLGVGALIDTWRESVRMANALADRLLVGSAMIIAERVSLDEEGTIAIEIPYGALEMLSSAAQDRVFYRVDGPPGHLVTGYDDLPVAHAKGQGPAFADATFRSAPVRVASVSGAASTGIDEIPFTVTLAETTIARQELTRAIMIRSALRLLAMILGAAAIVWIAVTVSLRPLYRLSDAIAERNPADMSPIETHVPSEVRSLVQTINSFMRRLKSSMDGLRNFTGNAGHQLRTPLSVVRTQLALMARASSLSEAQQAAQKGDAAVGHAERVLAQLLLLARVDGAAGAGPDSALVDLTALARDLTAEHIPAAAEAGIDLGFEGAEALSVHANPILLGEALRNLISNAILHGGRDTVVTIRVRRDDNLVLLEVEDNGPGIPSDAHAAVISRFSRGRAIGAGMGLGLPVVEEIANLFGGRLTLSEGAEGRGLLAVVALPAQPDR